MILDLVLRQLSIRKLRGRLTAHELSWLICERWYCYSFLSDYSRGCSCLEVILLNHQLVRIINQLARLEFF